MSARANEENVQHPRVTFILIRHGEASEAACDEETHHFHYHHHDAETKRLLKKAEENPCLTRVGVEQATETARYLQGALSAASERGDVEILCSPMKRAEETLYEFQRTWNQTLFGVKAHYLKSMIEYRADVQGTAISFVDQIFDLFQRLRKIVAEAKRHKTVLLFGHSVMIATLLTLFVTHNHRGDLAAHRKCVIDRIVVPDENTLIDSAFVLANCSLSVVHGYEITEEDKKTVEWKVMSTGKCDHLRSAGFMTGYPSAF